MITLQAFTLLMIGLFALIGALRGWIREIVAMLGLVLSIFIIGFLGTQLLRGLGLFSQSASETVRNSQFWIFALVHLGIAFFSYQGPTLAGTTAGGKIKRRETLQDGILGAIFGALNGWLIIGTILFLLEFQILEGGWVPRPLETSPISAEWIVRQPGLFDAWLFERFPLMWPPNVIAGVLVVAMLFVLIVIL